MPWPTPTVDLANEALQPAARMALYAMFVSACGNDTDTEARDDLKVICLQLLETEFQRLNKQHVQLLAFWNMWSEEKVLPESCDASAPTTVTVSPDLVHAFTQCKSQEDVPINMTSYYNCDNPTIIDVANDRGEESAAQFIQESFMDMAIKIEQNNQGNKGVNRVGQGIRDQLPKSPGPTQPAILNCLVNSIQKGKYIPETECFVLKRWVFKHTNEFRQKVVQLVRLVVETHHSNPSAIPADRRPKGDTCMGTAQQTTRAGFEEITQSILTHDIKIFGIDNKKPVYRRLLLDPQVGFDAVSDDIPGCLNLPIARYNGLEVQLPNGRCVKPLGTVEATWQLCRHTQQYTTNFLVIEDIHFDMLLGKHTLLRDMDYWKKIRIYRGYCNLFARRGYPEFRSVGVCFLLVIFK